MKDRLQYIDAAKGILIILLILHHTDNVIYRADIFDMPDSSILKILTPTSIFAMSFFMPAFFLITGLCTNFNCSIKEFVVKNIKQLLIPTITLSIIAYLIQPLFGLVGWDSILHFWIDLFYFFLKGGPWFICSLFTCKIILQILLKIFNNKIIFFSSIAFFISGATIHLLGFSNNVFWIRHSLLMFAFLTIGYLLKGNDLSQKFILLPASGIFIILFIFLFNIYGHEIPHITRKIVIHNFWESIIVFLTSGAGSIAFIGLIKKLNIKNQ